MPSTPISAIAADAFPESVAGVPAAGMNGYDTGSIDTEPDNKGIRRIKEERS